MGDISKDHKPPMPKQQNSQPNFAAADTVRVKAGVCDPDYTDMPLGGWAGRVAIIQAGNPPTYLIHWTRETLDAMHPVYRQRCERDGLDFDQMWLLETDLEPCGGPPVKVEQPTEIKTRPLDMHDQDDRIRAIFGLTHDDLLPAVDSDSLRVYQDYLAKNLLLPFAASWRPEAGQFSEKKRQAVVTGLGDPHDDSRIDDTYGLICTVKFERARGDAPLAELDVAKRDHNGKLVADYQYWFWNFV